MTGIIVDKFGDKLYMFSDGLVCAGDLRIVKNFTSKVRRYEDKHCILLGGFCGTASFIDNLWMNWKHLAGGKKVDLDDFRLYVANEYKERSKSSSGDNIDVQAIFISYRKKSKETEIVCVEWPLGTMQFEVTDLPQFLGSGTVALTASYEALQVSMSEDEAEYVDNISRCYDITSDIISSCGNLAVLQTLEL